MAQTVRISLNWRQMIKWAYGWISQEEIVKGFIFPFY